MNNIASREQPAIRYELLPFASAQSEVQAVGTPLTLTVTCSPKHGNDRTVELAGEFRARGHMVIVHLAARMVQSTAHLDTLLRKMREADVHDVFLVGGDQFPALGPYPDSYALLQTLREHADAPRTIGVTAYPEGHPQISAEKLHEDLLRKAPLADYLTTQMCFEAPIIQRWLERVRADGVTLPAYLGLPGHVDRKRLLEISLKVGVGNSISYLRKQHGALKLAGRASAISDRVLHDVRPLLDNEELGVAGLHMFTFNKLAETLKAVERARLEVAV